MLITNFITVPLASLILAASSGGCQAPAPGLMYKATASKVKFNISESAGSLTALHSGRGSGVVLGLTVAPLYYDYKSFYEVTKQGSKTCLALKGIKLFFRARPVVFISEEFPRASCEFDAILWHEKKHVRALKKFQAQRSKEFKKEARTVLDQIKPVYIRPGGEESAKKKIEQKIQRRLDGYLKQVLPLLAREQAKIDSPAEYQRVNTVCLD